MAEPHFVRRCTGYFDDYEKHEVFACEGAEQRVVPTGVAARDNEIDGAPAFQQKHWQRVATFASP